MVYSWHTTKVSNGFRFTVQLVGYQVPTVTLKTGVVATRAQAVTRAKAWKMHLKATGATAAA